KIVVNDQRIHAIFHEPLAHCGAGERGEVLVGGVVGRWGGDEDRVFERTGRFEGADRPDDVRILLTDRDVNGIYRAELRITTGETDLVDLRLVDDRVDRDGRFAGATVTDDELALS